MNKPDSTESFKRTQLRKLGVDLNKWDYVVALAGNPNTGKSTVFNALTGLRQHTGNWPGKTVTRAEGAYEYRDKRYKIVDLPGTYSLLSTSEDEEIARNFILFGQPDVTLVVVDATRLERNLNLTLQILEITNNVVVCLNLMDEAKRKGISIDIQDLQSQLGVPVIETVARYNEGLDQLLNAISEVAENKFIPKTTPFIEIPEELNEAVNDLVSEMDKLYPGLPNKKWVAIRLLEGDEYIQNALGSGEILNLSRSYHQQAIDLNKELELINAEEV